MPPPNMDRHIPPLLATRYFEAAARHLSFTRAAHELHVTQGAISLQIRKLEEFLGVPLFRRLARKVELTDEGQQFYTACRQLLDGLETATRRITRSEHRETLVLSTIPTISTLWLMPRLASFTAMHPDIDVRVVADLRPVDMQAENIDVALRVGRLPGQRYPAHYPGIDLVMLQSWVDVEADFLFHDTMIPIASLRWCESHGPIEAVADLVRARLVHTASRPLAWPQWLRAHGVEPGTRSHEPEYGHFYIALGAAQDDKGVALIPDILVEGYPGRTAFRRLLPELPPLHSAGAYYLLTRTSSRKQSAIAKFRAWVLAEAKKEAISQANPRPDKKSFVPLQSLP